MRHLILLSLLTLLTGCTESRSYSISVKNDAGATITIGLVKEGGPYEQHWASPEDRAIDTAASDETAWDSVVVAPGKTATAGPVKGQFEKNAVAILRIYDGERELSSILSVSRGSPDRVEVLLFKGDNSIVVTRKDGRLDAQRLAAP